MRQAVIVYNEGVHIHAVGCIVGGFRRIFLAQERLRDTIRIVYLSGLCACGHFDDDRLSRRVSADAQNRGKDRTVDLSKNRSSVSGTTFKRSERKQGCRSRRYRRRSKDSKGDAECLSVSPSEVRRLGERTSNRNDLVRRPSDRRRAPRRYSERNQKHSKKQVKEIALEVIYRGRKYFLNTLLKYLTNR